MAGSTCAIEACARESKVRGWCMPHYKRWKRHGDPLGGGPERHRGRLCIIVGCGRKHEARGYCATHYERFTRNGDPLGAEPIREYCERATGCQIDGCERQWFARGYCWSHYYRDWRYGDTDRPIDIRMSTEGPCLAFGCDRERHGRGYCSMHHQRLAKGTLHVESVACISCGDAIDLGAHEPHGRRKRPIHISRCDNCTRPANPITASRLYQRDGEICGICGEAVDMGISYPDPRSPSVDHVMPLSKGGPNTPENCALTHFVCNVQKRARVGWTSVA